MMSTVGKLVRDRREALRLRPAEVAEQARLAEEALEALEEGRGNVTAAAMDRLADVLAVDPTALRSGRIEGRPSASIFFFDQATFPDFRDLEDRPKVAEAFAHALALLEIDTVLGHPARRPFEPEPPTPEAHRDGYRLANRVRSAIGNEVDPLPDLAELMEEQFDILVCSAPLASRAIAALTVKDNVRGARAVLLNTGADRRANPSAARVDLAHELCHALFDPASRDVELVVDEVWEDDRARRLREDGVSPRELSEKRARAFAAELLMPAEGLRALLGKPQYEMSRGAAIDLVTRARSHFVTPIEIAANHLTNREYIATWLRGPLIEWAREQEPWRGPGKRDAPAAPPRLDVLQRRVLVALEREVVTNERARELLGLSPWDELPVGA